MKIQKSQKEQKVALFEGGLYLEFSAHFLQEIVDFVKRDTVFSDMHAQSLYERFLNANSIKVVDGTYVHEPTGKTLRCSSFSSPVSDKIETKPYLMIDVNHEVLMQVIGDILASLREIGVTKHSCPAPGGSLWVNCEKDHAHTL